MSDTSEISKEQKSEMVVKVAPGRKQKIITILYLSIFGFIISYFIYSKISMLFTPVPTEVKDYSIYPWYSIPFVYIFDYFMRAWNSLIFAFILSGIIHEFIPQEYIKKVLGSGKFRDYFIAAALAPVFITCSCSVIPIYAGILMSGASVGVTMTFFLMAPAANMITILMTGEYIGWELGIWRLVFSFIAAIVAGYLFDRTKVSKKIAEQYHKIKIGEAKMMLIERTFYDKVEDAYRFSWSLVRQILPLLLIGLATVSYLAAYLPDEWIALYFTGFTGIVIAAILGGPLYTPTLVEIVLTRALLDKGMSGATALSFLMGQPYDIVSMVPNSRYFKWKGIVIYFAVFFAFSILSGVLYGIVAGNF
ncbi:MAG: permease [Candidatus Helarchaeota archaeon]